MICDKCKKPFTVVLDSENAQISCECGFNIKIKTFCEVCESKKNFKMTNKYYSFKCRCRITYIYPEQNIKTYINGENKNADHKKRQ